jgi:hypothetical protein
MRTNGHCIVFHTKRHYHFYQFNQLCLANPNLRLCGSSHGWFALVDDSTSIITLMKQMFELKCLGNNILFIGTCGDSISVSALYFFKSLQRDSIYFACCLIVYDVNNEKYIYHCRRDAIWESNIWIQPHFQWNCERRLPHGLQGEQSTQSKSE